MERIDRELLDLPVSGVNLGDARTFGEVLGDGPTLVVFLRHFG